MSLKTGLPLSTIAYNEDVLCKNLVRLNNDGIVSFFVYIVHQPEGDSIAECKEHIHCYVEFYDKVDPFLFRDKFRDAWGNNTTLLWRRSQFVDWYYYNLHDEDYLARKGLIRQWHYDRSCMITLEEAELDRMIIDNPLPTSTRLRTALLNGVSEKEMFKQGLINPVNVAGVCTLSSILNNKIDERWRKK